MKARFLVATVAILGLWQGRAHAGLINKNIDFFYVDGTFGGEYEHIGFAGYGPNASTNGSADTWGTILDQYCEGMPSGTTTCTAGTHVQHPTSSVLRGVWFDKSAPAPGKATTSQIAAEAVSAAAFFRANSPQPPDLLNAQFVIASPSGAHPDGFPHGFCGWHSSTTSSFGNVAYTNLPYVPDLAAASCTTIPSPGPLDGYESTETHEYAESVTDPFPSSGWLKGGAEIGDLCETQDAHLTINNATYDVQGLWSNAANAGAGGCVTSG